MTTYFDFNNNIQDHKYIFIIDDYTYKANNTKELIQRVEEDFNLTGVKHWISNLKVPRIYHNRFDFISLNGRVLHDIKGKKYRYSITIDDKTYSNDSRNELIKQVEESLGIVGVKHWITNSKIPNMYKDRFDYVALDGKVIHDATTKQYKFNVSIDGKTYSNDLRIEVIRQIEEEYKISGVERWFITKRIPQKYHNMFSLVKINDVVIYNKENRKYKQVVIIDGVEYKANLKSLIINEIEEKYNINRVSTWFTNYRLPKSQHGMFNEVIVNGEVIYPKERRGFE